MKTKLLALLFFLLPTLAYSADINEGQSRTSGVAPLSVVFNADLWESSSTERRFHELEYIWDFGDTSPGTWSVSGKSKNRDTGPVAAHVYETAGDFTATLTIRDADGVVGTPSTFEIEVLDPDTEYSGTDTTCISTGSNFTGCPSGAAQVTSSNMGVIDNYSGTNKRVLFKRGDSWSTGSTIGWAGGTGPTTIGAFGTCTSPDDLGICSNAPQITLTANTDLFDMDVYDWRVMDLSIVGNGTGHGFHGMQGNYANTVSRVKIANFGWSVQYEHWRDDLNELSKNSKITFYSCEIGAGLGTYGMGIYMSSEYPAILGNVMLGGGQHTLRMMQSYIGVIGHNEISGASYGGTNYGGELLKLHAPNSTDNPVGNSAGAGIAHTTRYTVVTSNFMGGSRPWPIELSPQNDESASDERLFDIIFEKNQYSAEHGDYFNSGDANIIRAAGYYYSIRNNVFDLTEVGAYPQGIVVYSASGTGLAETEGIHIDNNTFYRSDSSSELTLVSVYDSAFDITIRNNLVSAPNTTTVDIWADNVTPNPTVSNNLEVAASYFTDPDNATPTARDFSLVAGATNAIDAGTTLDGVFSDFDDGDRVGSTYDIGAFEYGSTMYETGTEDTTAPDVDSTTISADGETVTIVFTETVVTTTYSGGLNLDCDASDIVLTLDSGSGTTRVFTAASTINSGESCTLDYTGTDEIVDTSDNDLVIVDDSVTNNSELTSIPTVKGVICEGCNFQ